MLDNYLELKETDNIDSHLQQICSYSRKSITLEEFISLQRGLDLPDQDVLAVFGGLSEPSAQQKVAKAKESRHLAALLNALLPKPLLGKVSVREAERLMQSP